MFLFLIDTSSDSAKWLEQLLSKEVDDVSAQQLPQSAEELRKVIEDLQKENQALWRENESLKKEKERRMLS